MQYKIISPESAYLALYRDSGVMMLIVNQDDIVYEKDLARTPLDAAKDLKECNPDSTWRWSEIAQRLAQEHSVKPATAKSALFLPKKTAARIRFEEFPNRPWAGIVYLGTIFCRPHTSKQKDDNRARKSTTTAQRCGVQTGVH
jgi:hypothetical protein